MSGSLYSISSSLQSTCLACLDMEKANISFQPSRSSPYVFSLFLALSSMQAGHPVARFMARLTGEIQVRPTIDENSYKALSITGF